ncbi:hypothetical protein AVEN_147461-1 [Araneus ventricosus]|uniref:DUF4371 domain-containing protein n=1 Tax=Araneus ventricosus TaxID=182803 RepID=A0A4Y2R666_ARAVE|nr:hypothetical protein AVEN_147461-1 [Araneus ventricosus]
MSEIIRYVHIENKKVEIKALFLSFFQLTGKKAVGITEDILKVVEWDGLDTTMCRRQGHGNASITVCSLRAQQSDRNSETELPKFLQSLVENNNELSADGIPTEIPRLERFLKAAKFSKEVSLGCTSLRFLEFEVEYELFNPFPNLTLALRFFLT